MMPHGDIAQDPAYRACKKVGLRAGKGRREDWAVSARDASGGELTSLEHTNAWEQQEAPQAKLKATETKARKSAPCHEATEKCPPA